MESIISAVKKLYHMMQIVPDEANSDISVKFVRYGSTDMDVWFALKTKEGIELYDSEGVCREVIGEGR